MSLGGFLPPVVVEIVGEVGKFQAALGEAKAGMSNMEAAVGKFQAVGKVATAAVAVGVVAIAAASVQMASKFNQSMELIHTQAGAAQSEVDGLKQKVLDLAPTVGIGPDKLAEGLYHIESTGYRGKEAMDILTASAKLASIGLADLDTVTYAMSGVMSVGLKDIQGAADATAYLNTIVGMGDMSMSKLTAAIGTGVLPSFKSAGLGMRDFGAALATISDNSTSADEAATRLRMTVALMSAPSRAAVTALGEIGLSSTKLASDMQKPDGLLAAVMDLKTHLEASGKSAVEQNQIIEHAFGGGKSSSAILTLIEESDRLKSKYGQLGDAGSRAASMNEAWAQQQKQLSQQLKELGASAQKVGVEIGEFLIPKIQAAASWMAKHTGVVKIAALLIGGVLVAAMVAFTASVVANTAALLANPVTWIVLAIVAAIGLLVVGVYELVKHWSTVWKWIKDVALGVWHALVVAWNATWNGIMSAWNWAVKNIFEPIGKFLNVLFVQPFKQAFKLAETIFSVGWAVIRTIVLFAWGFLSVIFKDIAQIMVAVFGPVLKWLERVWGDAWKGVQTATKWANDNVIQPTSKAIQTYAIKPIGDAIKWLENQWHLAWIGMQIVIKWVNDSVIQPIGRAIVQYGINQIRDGIKLLESVWNSVWNSIKSAISSAWGYIQPILHAISSAVSSVISAIGSIGSAISNSPAAAGGAFAHMLGFDEGGWVPGAPGEPMLAIVHGGEYVLSRDMLAGSKAASFSVPASSGVAGGGGAAPGYVPIVVNLGGTQMAAVHAALIQPAQRYKQRNGVTGLS